MSGQLGIDLETGSFQRIAIAAIALTDFRCIGLPQESNALTPQARQMTCCSRAAQMIVRSDGTIALLRQAAAPDHEASVSLS